MFSFYPYRANSLRQALNVTLTYIDFFDFIFCLFPSLQHIVTKLFCLKCIFNKTMAFSSLNCFKYLPLPIYTTELKSSSPPIRLFHNLAIAYFSNLVSHSSLSNLIFIVCPFCTDTAYVCLLNTHNIKTHLLSTSQF